MSCFADINVSQGSVATHAVGFLNPFNRKFTGNLSMKIFFKIG